MINKFLKKNGDHILFAFVALNIIAYNWGPDTKIFNYTFTFLQILPWYVIFLKVKGKKNP